MRNNIIIRIPLYWLWVNLDLSMTAGIQTHWHKSHLQGKSNKADDDRGYEEVVNFNNQKLIFSHGRDHVFNSPKKN